MNTINKYIVLALLSVCSSCATLNNEQINNENSLYAKMGQQTAIDNIVDNLINIIGQDDLIFAHFAESNIRYFRKNLTLFLCNISDGPCQYNGDSMQDIHRGMRINENQFNHFVELFIDAMDAAGISYPLQNQLLARLAPLRKNIIKI